MERKGFGNLRSRSERAKVTNRGAPQTAVRVGVVGACSDQRATNREGEPT